MRSLLRRSLLVSLLLIAACARQDVTRNTIEPTSTAAMLGCLLADRNAATPETVQACANAVPDIKSAGLDSGHLEDIMIGKVDYSSPAITGSCGGGDPRIGKKGGGGGKVSIVFADDGGFTATDASGWTRYYDSNLNFVIAVKAEEPKIVPTPPDKKEEPAPDAGTKSTSQTPSACTMVLVEAATVLANCEDRGWKGAGCESLASKMGHCPESTRILVDPEQGFTCQQKVDPDALKAAYVKLCSANTTPGPGDGSPCTPPTFDDKGRVHDPGDMCSNPKAMVTPDGDDCTLPLTVGGPGGVGNATDINALITWARSKLGGPVFTPPMPKPLVGPGNTDPPRLRD